MSIFSFNHLSFIIIKPLKKGRTKSEIDLNEFYCFLSSLER